MSNSNKKNMDRVAKSVKPLVAIDWTTSEGDTPFFDYDLQKYAVAVDTGFVKMDDAYFFQLGDD